MTAFGIDRPAAWAAALDLAKTLDVYRTHLDGVGMSTAGHTRLPLALRVLDHCGGDPVIAICIVASLIDPDNVPPPLPVDAPPASPLQLAPAVPETREAPL